MKTQFVALHHENGTSEITEPVLGRNSLLDLLMRLLWVAAMTLPAFGAQAGAVLTTLHSFQPSPNGTNPTAGLVQGSDGNFYGTTQAGGTDGFGNVFKISTNGTLSTLYSFSGGDDGFKPQTGLVQGGDGSFYGTTWFGGLGGGYGTVFRLTIVPAAPVLEAVPLRACLKNS